MTAVGGTTISYDGSGNPTNWYNGTTSYSGLSWKNGRQLTQITTGGKTSKYTYDADGIRSTKDVNGTLHEYLTLNGKVVWEKIGEGTSTKIMVFSYDAQGRPFGFKFSKNNGTSYTNYFYALNQQGDVVKIFRPITVKDADGNTTGYTEKTYATYTYDAWGKLTGILDSGGNNLINKQTTSTALANLNPLRYRGYYYDSETGFYYLQSRYYDPANYRFVSADSYTTTELADPLSANMFAYCSNNPVMRTDPTGEAWWHWAVAAVAVTALVVVSVATCGGAAAAIGTAASIVTGTCSTVSAGATIATGAAMGAGIAFTGSVVTAATTSDSLDEFAAQGETALINTAIGAGGGALAGYANSVAYCFVAGTLVVAENGNVPIEQIKVGELVWAWDEKTDDVVLKQVVETYINETTELTHVFVNGEEIIATPTHPFYCPTKGWTDAAHLRAGDILVLVNREYVVVEKVQHELLKNPVKVYNFQVADYHTYYVATGVLVHNACSQRAAIREAKRSVNIPMNETPTSVQEVKMIGQSGRTVFAKLEIYGDRFIRNDLGGHLFRDGGELARHFNAGVIIGGRLISNGQHFFY